MTSRLFASAIILLGSLVAAAAASDPPAPQVLVADVREASLTDRLLATSLQGIANRGQGGAKVFLITSTQDEDWLRYALRLSPAEARTVALPELLEAVRPDLKGQVLYDAGEPFTINIATTAAGVQDAAVSTVDLGLPTLLDLRHRWNSPAEARLWAESSLLPECDRNRAAILAPESTRLRDLLVQAKMFVLDPPESGEQQWFEDTLTRLAPGTAIYGDAPDFALETLSRTSHFLVRGSRAANLSFLSGLDAGRSFYQYFGYVDPGAPRYLAFIFDCSDLGFAINDLPALWDRPNRGSLPLGWAVPSAMLQAAPAVLRSYYGDVYRFGADSFVLGPSGAGEMDVSAAGAPFTFFRATGKASDQMDADAALFSAPADLAELGPAVSRLAGETGIRGAFVVAATDFEPLLFDGIPVISAPWANSVADAVSYLDNVPLERRFAALRLNPSTLTPADAGHIAAHVARRYVVVTPEQMVDLMRLPAQASQPGEAAAAVTSVQYPDPAEPGDAVPVKAAITSIDPLLSAAVIYQAPASARPFYEVMHSTEDGYAAQLPPLRCGGEIGLNVRAIDSAGRASWSPTWKISIPRVDSDGDGLSDAEEDFLLTDPKATDTDGDGLLDGNDPTPLRFDRVMVDYLGPIYPPSDAPYLPEPGGTTASAEGRLIRPGQACTYWLPAVSVPDGAPSVVGIDGSGPAAITLSTDGSVYAGQFSGNLIGAWQSSLIPTPPPGGVFVKLACPEGAAGELRLWSIGLLSVPEAPSFASPSVYPLHPGPGQQVIVSATAFSPKGIAHVALTYRVVGDGEITIPMHEVGASQRYVASIPPLENREGVDWWITARDPGGLALGTPPAFLPVGSRARETVALLSTREFVGDWSPIAEWNGAGRQASASGLRETASANLNEGTYTVWILAGGRGQGIGVYAGDRRVGGIDPKQPDGWQHVGRVKLDSGRCKVQVVSEEVPGGPPGAQPRYAEVILTADTTFQAPSGQLLDVYNSLALLSPRPEEVLTGRVDLSATGAGNVTAVEFSLDGQVLRRVTGPPFTYSLNTQRIANGPHTLKVTGFDRNGSTGLELTLLVTVAN